jgi:adenylate cyclase
MRNVLRSPLAVGLLVSASVSLGILGVRSAGGLELLELAGYDWWLKCRPASAGLDPRIVLVGVTEDDIREQDRWPLTDATVAEALQLLLSYQPRAIGLDIYRDIHVPPGREELNALFTKYRQIVTVTLVGDTRRTGVPPPFALTGSNQVGFNDLLVDSDGVVRRGLLFLDDGETMAYSLALRLALLYLEREGITPQPDRSNPHLFRLGPTTVRPLETYDVPYAGLDARGYQILLDFHRPFLSVSLTSLLSGQVDPTVFTDKVVLIGVTAHSVPDLFHLPTPVGSEPSGLTYGVVIHAHIVSQLLHMAIEGEPPLMILPKNWEAVWIVIWGFMGATFGLRIRSPWRYAVLTVAGLLALSIIGYSTSRLGWWMPVVPPGLNWLISAGLVTAYMSYQENQQRTILMQLFSRHVSPEVVKAIWEQRDQFLDGGRPRSKHMIATVLFLDLKGYTGVAEKLDPEVLMGWLNTYLESMAEVVLDHQGVIDDYAGDGLKANFGIPFAQTTKTGIGHDAVKAVRCALAMNRELNRLNSQLRERNFPTVGMRIGIFTGPVVAGSIGSAQRLKYTTIGDTVNTAARIESVVLDEEEPGPSFAPSRILIGESTFQYVNSEFRIQRVGQMILKGKEHPITVYRVIADLRAEAPAVTEEVQT